MRAMEASMFSMSDVELVRIAVTHGCGSEANPF